MSLSHSSLFVLAVVCLVSLVSAQAIERISWANADCTGTQTVQSSTPIGRCTKDGGGDLNTYTAAYCNTASTFLTVTYNDAACSVATAYSVNEIPTTCGAESAKHSYNLVNCSTAVASPVSFPPSGWITHVACKNKTDNYNYANTCDANVANVACTSGAYNSGFCVNATAQDAQKKSFKILCSHKGDAAGMALFASDNCDYSTIQAVSVSGTECYRGEQHSCPGGGATFPSDIPFQGIVSYDDQACATHPKATLYAPGCLPVVKQSFACSAKSSNGTQTATFTQYATAASCPATPSGMPITRYAGACVNKQEYLCDFYLTGAASSVSFSLVAMIVAAFAALVSARSL